MDPALLREEIEAFLAAHHTASLATVDEHGVPHAANVLYAVHGVVLYWMSDAQTRHSQHIAARSLVTATVAPDYADFQGIRGLQIFGAARRLEGAEALKTVGRMIARYGFLAQLAKGPAALRAAFEKAGFYCLEPRRITFIDNTRGFGYKETLEIPVDQ